MIKKPPDKYKVIKISLKQILKNTTDINKLNNIIIRTNKLIIHTYQFLRLWILNKYHKRQNVPKITKDIIKMAFKVLTTKSQGPKPKGTNLSSYNELTNFYDTIYSKLGYNDKLSGLNLSQIINYMCVDMITNIENNIKQHFIDYVKRYVNSSFKDIHNKILDKYNGIKKTLLRKKLKKELYTIKQDLFNRTILCDKKYHKWLIKNRNNILPQLNKKEYYRDINSNPQKYIPYMIFMNIKLEKIEKKMFQFFPLRTEIKPHYIPIDTKSLIELFVKNKNNYLTDISNKKVNIWSTYFNMNHKVFKKSKYTFDYRILTDGYAVSIQFINNNKLAQENQKKINMKNAKMKMYLLYKNLSQEDKEKLKQKLKDDKKKKDSKFRKKNRAEFKKLSKEEQKKIKEKLKKKYIEFPYLDEVDENTLNDIKNSNRVYIDPGKRSLLVMIDDKNNKFIYTNKQKLHETKQLKYQRLQKNYKKKNGILKIEHTFNLNSKTCYIKKFKEYIKEKNQLNDKLFIKYEKELFRRYKWYSYLNKTRSRDKLLNKIKNKFGKDCKLIYGDWGEKTNCYQMRNFISTPKIGLKRKISEKFKIYNIDEFRTSCLNNITEEKCKNLYLPDKKGKLRKLHAVLTFKMENNRCGCINRDWNAVRNMRKITDYWLQYGERPIKFRRNYDLKTGKLKDSNPCKKVSNRIKPSNKFLNFRVQLLPI